MANQNRNYRTRGILRSELPSNMSQSLWPEGRRQQRRELATQFPGLLSTNVHSRTRRNNVRTENKSEPPERTEPSQQTKPILPQLDAFDLSEAFANYEPRRPLLRSSNVIPTSSNRGGHDFSCRGIVLRSDLAKLGEQLNSLRIPVRTWDAEHRTYRQQEAGLNLTLHSLVPLNGSDSLFLGRGHGPEGVHDICLENK
jgi:hypothetical protein